MSEVTPERGSIRTSASIRARSPSTGVALKTFLQASGFYCRLKHHWKPEFDCFGQHRQPGWGRGSLQVGTTCHCCRSTRWAAPPVVVNRWVSLQSVFFYETPCFQYQKENRLLTNRSLLFASSNFGTELYNDWFYFWPGRGWGRCWGSVPGWPGCWRCSWPCPADSSPLPCCPGSLGWSIRSLGEGRGCQGQEGQDRESLQASWAKQDRPSDEIEQKEGGFCRRALLGATWFRWLSQSEVRVDGDSGMPRGIPSHQLLSLFNNNSGKLPSCGKSWLEVL